MKVLVLGNERSYTELCIGNNNIQIEKAIGIESFFKTNDALAFFNLNEDAHLTDYGKTDKPVFINSVTVTLQEMNARKNVVRINGWNSFLKRPVWEIAGSPDKMQLAVLDSLQKKTIIVPDEPGFISARIISMIINEAFYTKGENISTEKEIDIAMKLGTNYPFGPFEWAEEIGIKNIYDLLISLAKNDVRYNPAPLLKKQANQ